MENEAKDCYYSELDEAQVILTRLQSVNETISDYVMNSSDDESKLDLCNKINTFSDCIGMYAERLEKIINELNSKGE